MLFRSMVECFDDFCDVADIISVSPPSYFCLWFVGSLSPCSASRPEYQNDFSESISFYPDLTPIAPAFQWFNCSYWEWYNRHKNNSGVRLTLAENKRKFSYDWDADPPNDSSDLVYFSNAMIWLENHFIVTRGVGGFLIRVECPALS